MNDSFFDFELFAAPDGSAALDKLQGKGRARILILFAVEADEAQDQAYLSAILKPLGFDLQNDAFFLAMQKKQRISASALLRRCDPRYILLFGCRPEDCGIRIPLADYQALDFQGKTFLKADSLHQIRTDREHKDNRRAGALWNALKEMFA